MPVTEAVAHIQLIYPPQRYTDQKYGPCGRTGGGRGDVVTRLRPGATILVEWEETIEHPGHFRIGFDDDGDDIPDPNDFDDFFTDPQMILADNIPDTPNKGRSAYQITLPNIECDNCTLQVVQVMYDKPPWGPGGGNDLYYQCADLVLSADAPDTPNPDPGMDAGPSDMPGDMGPVTGGGCQTVPGSGSPGLVVLLLVAGMTYLRRRCRSS